MMFKGDWGCFPNKQICEDFSTCLHSVASFRMEKCEKDIAKIISILFPQCYSSLSVLQYFQNS